MTAALNILGNVLVKLLLAILVVAKNASMRKKISMDAIMHTNRRKFMLIKITNNNKSNISNSNSRSNNNCNRNYKWQKISFCLAFG